MLNIFPGNFLISTGNK